MPLFLAKKEVFAWIKDGKKTIDVRKGSPRLGEIAVFQCGNNHLRIQIARRETGKLFEVIRDDNYRLIIPTANNLEEALSYICRLYPTGDGLFTAYYLIFPHD
jgi:ASC-1-like (ASCH) protein